MTNLFQRSIIIRNSLFLLSTSLLSLQTPLVNAMGYGIYDSRALAMGGASVAIGDPNQAVFYNPALLSFHDGDEDKTRDGRTYIPTLVAQASTAIESAVSAVDDHLDTELSNALNAFNTQMSPENAGLVAKSSRDLRKVFDKVGNRDLTVDAFLGISASEPGDREGGAFYVGVRTIGVGTSNIPKADLDLLNEYIDAMSQISAGTSPLVVAMQHPNLIDSNFQFSDPTTKLTSSAEISALMIGEWGIAFAKEFSPWGQPVSFGLTPKLMRVDAYRDHEDFNNTDINSIDDGVNQFSDTKSSLTTFNADVGVATTVADHYRIGVSVKDVFAKNFSTKQVSGPNLTVKLRPRSRAGVGYTGDNINLGLDYDLQESTPIANEKPIQEIDLGAEYKLFRPLALRIGYRHDQAGAKGDMASGGIGYRGKRFVADLSYAQGDDTKGASLQMGWAF